MPEEIDVKNIGKHRDETSVLYMLNLAWPMIITTISFTVMQFVDRLMVSRYSDEALAAIGPSGMVSFIPASFALGLVTTINIFAGQCFGMKRYRDCTSYFWQSVYLGTAYSMVTFIVLWPFAKDIFVFLDQPSELLTLEADYFRIMLYCQFVVVFMWTSNHFFMGIHRPAISMWTAFVGQGINIIANYVLIFGKFGLPAMGIKGAGWGTFIGISAGVTIRMYVFLSPMINDKFESRKTLKIDIAKMRNVLRIGWPAGITMMVNTAMVGSILYYLIGKFGKDALAATVAVQSTIMLSHMPAVGVSIALTAAMSKSIGKGRKDIATKQTYVSLRMSVAFMSFIGLCFLLFRKPLISGWDLSESAAAAGVVFLIFAGVFQIFDAFALSIGGALRGAGDTLWQLWIYCFGAFVILFGGGVLIAKLFPSLGSTGPWVAYTGYIIFVSMANLWRFRSNKWQKIRLFKEEVPLVSAESE